MVPVSTTSCADAEKTEPRGNTGKIGVAVDTAMTVAAAMIWRVRLLMRLVLRGCMGYPQFETDAASSPKNSEDDDAQILKRRYQ